jgi:putative peptidoglycan lipid II flippase
MPLVLLSTLCFTVYGPIDSYWASRLGPANVSYLGYSQRLLIALGNLVVLGPVTVLTPYLAEQAARYQKKEFTKTLWTAIRITILLSAPLALILSMLRVPVIEILFQRGTFDATATQGVSSVLPGMLFGMVAMLIVILLLKALHSLGDIAGAAIIGATGSTSYFILSGLFSKYMGLDGIVLAYALTWWFLIGVSLWRFINLDIRFILPADIMKFIVQVVIPLILTGLCVHIGQKTCIRPIVEIGLINLTFRIGALSGSTFIIFMLLAWLLRMPEIRSLLEKICEQSYS